MTDQPQKFESFKAFYPFYLAEHQNKISRRLHVTGSILVLLVLAFSLISQSWGLLILLPIIGYGFAWVGHFFFEKNKPATFKYPLYSFVGDWVMLWQVLTGKLKL
ncbi:DUF962 domain-containing protein [Marinicella litoralis]|uniref:DUF962 domain-containing protein n=1 Tax=Marinicella litoralis TaxID=644220 RepID=A0A4R6XTB3_9GAMM|nr:DUF962 domain-containing protein [Marinicella litoralis]TDR23195.1 hypothetical protein C8D91_0054 [Marinicella litoralis]